MKKEIKRYLLVGVLTFTIFFGAGCAASIFTVGEDTSAYFPIARGMFGQGGSWDFLVYPMAWLMNFIAEHIVGYNYAVTILLATILIRSLAWPIYGKTNDMQLKMQVLAPEQAKIEAKYKDKVDKESQQRKSMETMQLYKKYKVSFFGCFMPFLQMPIFLAFYETLRRIPYTTAQYLNQTFISGGGEEFVVSELLYDFGKLKTTVFGIDLMKTATEGDNWQRWGIYIMAALVGITQIGTQLLSQRRANKQKEKMSSNVPEYRRVDQSSQQKQTQTMMKVMMYSMPVIMVIFIVTNTGALGWYWFVGNIYTALQTFITSKTSAKKLEKMKSKYEQKSYIG